MASGASRQAVENRKKKAKVAEDPRPELFDATRYDFERLELVVTDLVDRHGALLRENAELQTRIDARDVRTRALEAEVSDLQKRRDRTHKRLDGLIADLDRLEEKLGDGSTAAGPSSKRAAKRKKTKTPR